ncbi:MAG: hypothetical protein JWQ36_1208 [Enterovirga sp.]|jgi:hypothetical protein|nr:hypothetical protein [Enterovirga sp.]
MAAQATAQRPPEVEITESLRRDLTKQIRKLRWIGRPDEAERLELALAFREHGFRVRAMLSDAARRERSAS